MRPPAPGRLSTTTCCPRNSGSLSATMRMTMSVAPPAEYGTIRRTGRLGYAWDCAASATIGNSSSAAANSAAHAFIFRLRIIVVSSLACCCGGLALLHLGAAVPHCACPSRAFRFHEFEKTLGRVLPGDFLPRSGEALLHLRRLRRAHRLAVQLHLDFARQ